MCSVKTGNDPKEDEKLAGRMVLQMFESQFDTSNLHIIIQGFVLNKMVYHAVITHPVRLFQHCYNRTRQGPRPHLTSHRCKFNMWDVRNLNFKFKFIFWKTLTGEIQNDLLKRKITGRWEIWIIKWPREVLRTILTLFFSTRSLTSINEISGTPKSLHHNINTSTL